MKKTGSGGSERSPPQPPPPRPSSYGTRMLVLSKVGKGPPPLGKLIAPKPINLPSLKSEHHGNDPALPLVPSGGAGWGARGGEPPARTRPSPDPRDARRPHDTGARFGAGQRAEREYERDYPRERHESNGGPAGRHDEPRGPASDPRGFGSDPRGYGRPYERSYERPPSHESVALPRDRGRRILCLPPRPRDLLPHPSRFRSVPRPPLLPPPLQQAPLQPVRGWGRCEGRRKGRRTGPRRRWTSPWTLTSRWCSPTPLPMTLPPRPATPRPPAAAPLVLRREGRRVQEGAGTPGSGPGCWSGKPALEAARATQDRSAPGPPSSSAYSPLPVPHHPPPPPLLFMVLGPLLHILLAAYLC